MSPARPPKGRIPLRRGRGRGTPNRRRRAIDTLPRCACWSSTTKRRRGRGCAGCCAHPQIQVVAEARNGARGARAAARHAPDALFLDVQMPEVERPRRGRVAARSGAARSCSSPRSTTTRCRPSTPRAVDYLLKPADAERVRARRAALAARGPRARGRTPAPSPAGDSRSRPHRMSSRCATSSGWRRPTTTWCVHAGGRAPLLRRTLAGAARRPGRRLRAHAARRRGALAHVAAVQAPQGRRARC